VLVAAGAVVVVAAITAAAFALHGAPRPAGSRTTNTVLQRHEAANQERAAVWISQQLSPSSIVACDAAMCSVLEAHGFPAGNIRVLIASSPYPLTSTVVVETAAVRRMFGTSLAAQAAPEILSTVGSGSAIIRIRVVSAHGAAAYRQELVNDLAVRKQFGADLLGSSGQISTHPLAHEQLADGAVDTRLLYVITVLAGTTPIDIVDFGNIASGASPGLPLRYADLAEKDKAAHLSQAAYVSALQRVLRGLPAEYRPIRVVTVPLGPTEKVLRIELPAPSPLGLLGSSGKP
jgi:hypothetical protein